jgi:acyl-CoA thioesterase I
MNDAFLPYETSVEEARRNLEQMIDRIQPALPACEIIVMVMNPPTGEHLAPRPQIEAYNQAHREVAAGREMAIDSGCAGCYTESVFPFLRCHQ